MELLIWHEGLGSDDDAATEEESLARVLFNWPAKSMQDQLKLLQLLQGTYAFATGFGKPKTTLTHVELTSGHYCFERIEIQTWIALGVKTYKDNDQYIVEKILREVYQTYRLLHGSISMQLNECQLPLDQSPFEILIQLGESRRKLRKTAQFLSKMKNDQENVEYGEGCDALKELQTKILQLEEMRPLSSLKTSFSNFFPVYLNALDAIPFHAFHAIDGMYHRPLDPLLHTSSQLLRQSIELEIPSVNECAIFLRGHLLTTGIEPTELHLIYNFLRLREQEAYQRNLTQNNSLPWTLSKVPAAYEPLWASKHAYIDGFTPPKRRLSAKNLFADVLTASSNKPPIGFLGHDQFFHKQNDISLWRMSLYDLHTDVTSSRELILWRDGPCVLLCVIDSSTDSNDLVEILGRHLAQSIYLRDIKQEESQSTTSMPSFSSYIHINHATNEIQLHHIGKDQEILSSRQLAASIPPHLLEALQAIRYDLTLDNDLMDIFTKTISDGWIVVRRSGSLDRELIVLIDSKVVESIGDLSVTMNSLIHDAFQHIFM